MWIRLFSSIQIRTRFFTLLRIRVPTFHFDACFYPPFILKRKSEYSFLCGPAPFYHGLINCIDTKAKCRHLKKLTCKGTLRQVFFRVYRLEINHVGIFYPALWTVAPLPLLFGSTLPLPCVNKYTVYCIRIQCERGGEYGVLGFRQIKTCRKVPLQLNFFRLRHFALPSMSLIFLRFIHAAEPSPALFFQPSWLQGELPWPQCEPPARGYTHKSPVT